MMDIDDIEYGLERILRDVGQTLEDNLECEEWVKWLGDLKTRLEEVHTWAWRHYCSDYCECDHDPIVEYETVEKPVSDRYHDLFKQALEENYAWERDRSERQLGQPPCETSGCKGTLWYEDLEGGKYLVKCTRGCRIIYVEAWSPEEAITAANQR